MEDQNRMAREHHYYVYIVSSKSRRIYTGVTNNLFRRILQDKKGEIEGFTQQYKINRLVYYEPFQYVGAAIHREKVIKGWLRAKKIALIERENPTWDDLADDWGKPLPPLKLPSNGTTAGPSLRQDDSSIISTSRSLCQRTCSRRSFWRRAKSEERMANGEWRSGLQNIFLNSRRKIFPEGVCGMLSTKRSSRGTL